MVNFSHNWTSILSSNTLSLQVREWQESNNYHMLMDRIGKYSH